MIDRITAKQLVEAYLRDASNRDLEDDSYVVVDSATVEKDYGWIFVYQSNKFCQTRDLNYALLGNSPILVNKTDGSLQYLLIGRTVEERIRNYELQHTS